MKRIALPVAILLITTLSACRKIELMEKAPDCVWDRVEEYSGSLGCDLYVEQYTFRGENVYLFSWDELCIADATTEVMDADCKTLGYLGGYPASVMIDGVNFWANSTYVGLVVHHKP